MAAGKVTGTNREVEAVVAASFAARIAASTPGDKTQILMTPHRLTDTEFHAASSHSVAYGTYLWLHAIRPWINS